MKPLRMFGPLADLTAARPTSHLGPSVHTASLAHILPSARTGAAALDALAVRSRVAVQAGWARRTRPDDGLVRLGLSLGLVFDQTALFLAGRWSRMPYHHSVTLWQNCNASKQDQGKAGL